MKDRVLQKGKKRESARKEAQKGQQKKKQSFTGTKPEAEPVRCKWV